MVLITRSVTVSDLEKEHQPAIATPAIQVLAIHFDLDSADKPLVKGEGGVRCGQRPVEVCLVALAEPLIEWDRCEFRIERTALIRRQRNERANQQKDKTANQSTVYLTPFQERQSNESVPDEGKLGFVQDSIFLNHDFG